MFKSYLTTAFRFLLKNKTFSFINITGLAAGTLCCLYILLYTIDQRSYDRHHRQAGNLYRITTELMHQGTTDRMGSASPPIAPAMHNDFPEVLQFTRVVPAKMFGVGQHLLRYKDKSFYEKEAIFADSTFFDLFTYHFVYGTPTDALKEPYSLVLLQPTAEKLFGKEDPVGKVITIDNAWGKHDFKVMGVVDQSLGHTHILANLFLTMNSGGMGSYSRTDDRWLGDNFASSYVKLSPGADPSALEKKLPAFLNKYGAEQFKAAGIQKVLHLQPVTTIHTSTGYGNEMDRTVSSSFLNVLLLIAILIQVIACINFMNLSTARASKRAKEVGVRKVIGAGRPDLVRQFLGESLLLTLAGVLLALPLLWLALPYLNGITGAEISPAFLQDYRIWLLLAALVGVTGLLAGSYPAFYLSAFRAIRVLKGNFTSHISATGIRRSLVVFQFVLSIVLITGIIVIYSQLRYIQTKDLGFDKEQKLIFNFYTDDARAKMPGFINDLRQLSEVKVVSKTNNYPGQFVINDWGFWPAGGNAANSTDVPFMLTDENFIKSIGITILKGRDFHINDSDKVLVNETLIRKMGLDPNRVVGARLYGGNDGIVEIVGVMKDFNVGSLRDDLHPFMLRYAPNGLKGWDIKLSHIIAGTHTGNYQTLLEKIRTVWQRDLPGTPFEYAFLDQEVQKQYESEITLSKIINVFTGMAILISCLGLFGLAAFSAEQRNKEIGIRKVLGASIPGVVRLLSKDFLRLVAIAFVIATPIAWWAMHEWLQTFAYQVPVRWWMFALAGGMAIAIALVTVSSQAIRAALANPVRSLRSE
ncbi:MAG TPA: FtsX-like permease family protein [Puia sp.]